MWYYNVFHLSYLSLRTQARPAIEYVSGEEGLRPKSYFTVFSFVEYTIKHSLKYVMAPGSACGTEGVWPEQCCRNAAPFASHCVVSLLLVT